MKPMPSFLVSPDSASAISSAWARLSIAHGPAIITNGRSLANVTGPTLTRRVFGAVIFVVRAISDQPRLIDCRLHERGEQRMRLERLRLELGMELDADK